MKVLRRYFIREFFKYFLIVLIVFITISTVVEFFDRVEHFHHGKATAYLIIKYLLLRIPGVVLYVLPFACLFSVLLTIGIAAKWRETIVIRASGISIKSFFSSFLVLGLIISLFALVFGETVVPAATKKALFIRQVKILKRMPESALSDKALWLKGTDGSLIRIGGFIEDGSRIVNTSVFSFDETFGLTTRIEADEGEWTGNSWKMRNVKVFDFRDRLLREHGTYTLTVLDEPGIFKEVRKKASEMSFMELYTYYSRLERAGFKNLKYAIRLYEKLAYPSINFVMILFGAALGLSARWGGGVKAAGIGVIICVMYWLVYTISVSIGITGIVKPWIAPWISPAIFGLAGGIMFLRIKE